MTTTITVKTHDWPVEVAITDHVAERDDEVSTEQVAPDSEQSFHITQTRSVAFKELLLPASNS